MIATAVLRTPAVGWRTWTPALATGVVAVLLFAPRFAAPVSQFDGGISASAATFTLHGLLPYRDYWLLYGPLSGWLLAIPTAILGPSVELSRLAGLAVIAIQAAVAFAIATRWAPPMAAFVLAIVAAGAIPVVYGLEFSAWPVALALGLAGLWVRGWTRAPAVVAGILIGLAFLSRLDLGIYALVAALVFRGRVPVLAAFAVIAGAFAAFGLLTAPIDALFEQLVWFPLVGNRVYRGLPGIGSTVAPLEATMLTVALVLVPRILIVAAAVRCAVVRPVDRPLVALTVFAVLCQLQTVARADAHHYALAALPSILLLAPFLARPGLRSFSLLAGVSTLTLAIPVAVVASGVFAGPPGRDDALVQAAHATRLASAPTDRIFVGLTDTRHAFINPLIGYYLADRAPGTAETMFNPGITNRDATQTKMVTQLEASDTRVLLLDDAFARWTEPENDSAIAGSAILDSFVAREFATMCVFGPYRVMTRVEPGGDAAPCPDPAGRP